MSLTSVKTRFAPSPTGEMHFGNVRTALFNVLLAISKNGSFLLRVEDTDVERSSLEHEQLLYEDLKWLGLNWQEGPYKQSERKAIYDDYYQELLNDNKAYYCFCSEAQLALSRKLQLSQKLPPRYTGTCANLTKQEVDTRIANGEEPAIRFRVRPEQVIKFKDLVKGEQVFLGKDIGDFIIRRGSGTANFMFCNAIDDSLMGVTCALRGEDHLANTPRQLMILNTLGLRAPDYGHITLIVGQDGSKLSKRNGSKSIKTLREEGMRPEAVFNYLARLGHKYDDLKFSDLKTLGQKFSVENFGKSSAHYDEQHLNHWQKEAVLNISKEEFKTWLKDVLIICPENKRDEFAELMQQNIMFPNEALHWAKVLFTNDVDFTNEQIAILKEAGIEFFATTQEYIDNNKKNFDVKELTNHLKQKLGVSGKKLFMPLRLGLTMMDHGPELVHLISLMGLEKAISRINQLLNSL